MYFNLILTAFFKRGEGIFREYLDDSWIRHGFDLSMWSDGDTGAIGWDAGKLLGYRRARLQFLARAAPNAQPVRG